MKDGTITCPVCGFPRPVIFPFDESVTAVLDTPEWRQWVYAREDEIAAECEYVETMYHQHWDRKLMDMLGSAE